VDNARAYTVASMHEKVELTKVNRRILEVQSENIMLRREFEKLSKTVETQTRAFEDVKSVINHLLKTREILSEELGKAAPAQRKA
jgi:cell division protein FtsL